MGRGLESMRPTPESERDANLDNELSEDLAKHQNGDRESGEYMKVQDEELTEVLTGDEDFVTITENFDPSQPLNADEIGSMTGRQPGPDGKIPMTTAEFNNFLSHLNKEMARAEEDKAKDKAEFNELIDERIKEAKTLIEVRDKEQADQMAIADAKADLANISEEEIDAALDEKNMSTDAKEMSVRGKVVELTTESQRLSNGLDEINKQLMDKFGTDMEALSMKSGLSRFSARIGSLFNSEKRALMSRYREGMAKLNEVNIQLEDAQEALMQEDDPEAYAKRQNTRATNRTLGNAMRPDGTKGKGGGLH